MTSLRGPGGDRGASIVELALIAPVMILIVMGVVDVARGYQLQIRLENAAREGAAYAQLYPNRIDACPSGTDVVQRVMNEHEGIGSIPAFDMKVFGEDGAGVRTEITDCDPPPADSPKRVIVEVSGSYENLTPVVARVVGGGISITGSAEMEVQL